MATEEITGNGWHWLRNWGLALFFVALLFLCIAFFLPAELPPPKPEHEILPSLRKYDPDFIAARNSIYAQALLSWAGNRLLAAGFLMWLAGCLVEEIRKPHATGE